MEGRERNTEKGRGRLGRSERGGGGYREIEKGEGNVGWDEHTEAVRGFNVEAAKISY